jgi:hypothetical protein
MRPFAPALSSLGLLAATFLAACGTSSRDVPPPFTAHFPDEGPGRPPETPPPPTPEPEPTADPLWLPDAFPLGRTAFFGSFPSDVVRFGDHVFTADADAIEASGASVVPIDVSGPTPAASTRYATTTILASDLVDSLGAPGDASNPIGFGFYLNDVSVATDHLAFVAANAGGSDSVPTCSNVVAFDPTTGAIRQVVDLANPFTTGGPMYDSSGAPVPGVTFTQAGAEGVEFVPRGDGTGLLYVAMSNYVFGAPSYGAIKYPGTVQVFDVDPSQGTPVTPRAAAGLLVTQTLATAGYSPAAVTRWTGPHGDERVLVTVAGTSVPDAVGRLVPSTDASVEAYDGTSLQFLGTFLLGPAALSSIRPAVGHDVDQHAVAFFASSVNGEAYLLRLDGLGESPVDASRVAVLRGPKNGIPVSPASAGLPGGNVTGIALTETGKTLVVAGFGDLFAYPAPTPGRLLALSLPKDLVASSAFGQEFVPGTANLVTQPGRTLGALALGPPGATPEVYVAVGGAIDGTTFLGAGPASIGTLATFGAVR